MWWNIFSYVDLVCMIYENDLSLHEKKIKSISYVTTELQLSDIVIATDETTDETTSL